MNGLTKRVRVWWMYWRYRNITQRRQRLQMWMNRRRAPRSPRPGPYRARGLGSTPLYGTTSRRSWLPFLVMVVCLTLIATYGDRTHWNLSLLHGIGALIFLGGVYWATRVA